MAARTKQIHWPTDLQARAYIFDVEMKGKFRTYIGIARTYTVDVELKGKLRIYIVDVELKGKFRTSGIARTYIGQSLSIPNHYIMMLNLDFANSVCFCCFVKFTVLF
jgi:hypothetical protein